MRKALVSLIKDEDGQGMVEYGLIVALVSVAIIGTLTTMKDSLVGVYKSIESNLLAVGG